MVKLLKILLAYKLKEPKPSPKNGGFTLIELLVGLVLAFLVILPLLGFMVNMLQTDRQEQAKATSEQEIQTALNYIGRDLDQAVYIYDGRGLSQIKGLPQPANSTPVLVFWKRQFVSDIITTARGGSDDGFVYALVAYYIRTLPDSECSSPSSPWSCKAQITRVQIQDVVRDRSGTPINDQRARKTPGFDLFKPGAYTSVEEIMNAWTSEGDIREEDADPQVLIDYIDKTPVPTTIVCPAIQRNNLPPGVTQADYTANNYQQVPLPTAIQASGFFACVDVEKTSVQVFMRGNALARLTKKTNAPDYVDKQAAYFPRASIQVKGRGLFSTDQGE
jgi:type II secretory pathway component PulJ